MGIPRRASRRSSLTRTSFSRSSSSRSSNTPAGPGMTTNDVGSDTPLWAPTPERAAATNLAHFVEAARAAGYESPAGAAAVDYATLYAWSIAHAEQFWPAVWKFCGVIADTRADGSQWTAV